MQENYIVGQDEAACAEDKTIASLVENLPDGSIRVTAGEEFGVLEGGARLTDEETKQALHDAIRLTKAGIKPGRSCWLFVSASIAEPGEPEWLPRVGAWIVHPQDRENLVTLLEKIQVMLTEPNRQGLRALKREFQNRNERLDRLEERKKFRLKPEEEAPQETNPTRKRMMAATAVTLAGGLLGRE